MAKRYRYLKRTGNPQAVANFVVDQYVSEASTRITEWGGNYQSGISEYVGGRRAITPEVVKRKLGIWYTIVLRKRHLISRAYDELRNEYQQALGGVLGAPAPAPAKPKVPAVIPT